MQNNFCLLIALGRTVRTVGGADAAFEPSETLLRPLRKRFRFHFWGQKKTNNLVRPEWYLQQVCYVTDITSVTFPTSCLKIRV